MHGQPHIRLINVLVKTCSKENQNTHTFLIIFFPLKIVPFTRYCEHKAQCTVALPLRKCSRLRVTILRYCIYFVNPLTPNDPYSGRTAPLTYKRCILYIYSTNISTEYFNMVYTLRFFSPFKMQFVS